MSSANLENLSLHRSVDNSNLKLSTSLMYRSIAIHLDKRDTSLVTWKIVITTFKCEISRKSHGYSKISTMFSMEK